MKLVLLFLLSASTAFPDSKLILVDKAGKELTVQGYAKECEEKNVEIPTKMDCKDGDEIPVFQTTCPEGKPKKVQVTPQNYEELKKAGNGNVICDNPAYLHIQTKELACVPGGRLQVKAMPNGTQCVMYCRKHSVTEKEGTYQDINMICTQPSNGATCFFNTPVEKIVDGSHLPKPGTKEGDKVWMERADYLGGDCASCHDSAPFLVTSHFPANIAAKIPRKARPKYFVVGSDQPFDSWAKRYQITAPEANACTRCHRIGYPTSCGMFATTSAHFRPKGVTGPTSHPSQTKSCTGESHRWMPQSQTLTDADMQSIQFIADCCEERRKLKGELPPNSPCKWKLIAETAPLVGPLPDKEGVIHEVLPPPREVRPDQSAK